MLYCDLRAAPGSSLNVTVHVHGERHRPDADRVAWVTAQIPVVAWDGPVVIPESVAQTANCVTLNTYLSDYASAQLGDLPGAALGVAVVVVDPNGNLLLTRRGERVAFAPGVWSTTAGETIDDTDINNGVVDVYAVARRALSEELGLTAAEVFTLGVFRVHITSDNANITALARTTVGVTELNRRRAEVPDAWETTQVRSVPPSDLTEFVASHPLSTGVETSLGLAAQHLSLRSHRSLRS